MDVLGCFSSSQPNALSGHGCMTPLVLGIVNTWGLAVGLCEALQLALSSGSDYVMTSNIRNIVLKCKHDTSFIMPYLQQT